MEVDGTIIDKRVTGAHVKYFSKFLLRGKLLFNECVLTFFLVCTCAKILFPPLCTPINTWCIAGQRTNDGYSVNKCVVASAVNKDPTSITIFDVGKTGPLVLLAKKKNLRSSINLRIMIRVGRTKRFRLLELAGNRKEAVFNRYRRCFKEILSIFQLPLIKYPTSQKFFKQSLKIKIPRKTEEDF